MVWVCLAVVDISSLRDEHSMNFECLFVESGQKEI